MSVKELKLEEIMSESGQNEQKVQKILNILLEAPYFYREDDLSLFLFLLKYKRAFAGFFRKFYGWDLIVEFKCARLWNGWVPRVYTIWTVCPIMRCRDACCRKHGDTYLGRFGRQRDQTFFRLVR